MKIYFCWRCQTDVPFLDEDEWKVVAPHVTNTVTSIKRYREENGVGLSAAKNAVEDTAVKVFEEVTGYRAPSWDIVRHHRLADYGPECVNCGHLVRTPKASFCANCGEKTASAA